MRRLLVPLAGVVLVLAALYAGAAAYLGDRVAEGTTVAGVDIGGRSQQEAAEHLRTELAPTATGPVDIQVAGDSVSIDPREAGLELDIDATLDGLTGTSLDPVQLWRRLGDEGEAVPLQVSVDEDHLTQALREVAGEVDTQVTEGSVALVDGQVETTVSQEGRSLDIAATVEAVRAAWPRQDTVTGVVQIREPQLPPAEITRFTEEFAKPAMSGPVHVVVDGQRTQLSTEQLSRLITVEVEDGQLVGSLDEAALVESVRAALPDTETQAQDARLVLGEDGPQVVEAVTGAAIDTQALAEAVSAALTSDQRTATVPTEPVPPQVSTDDVRSWGVQEVVGQFRSAFPTGPGSEDRTHNIEVGLSHLDGVLVPAGEQFSLLEHLAPFTAERGYREAGVIVDGRLTEGMGGGLSQVSTVVYNTAFFAGVQLDEHTPHTYYIPRYPEGREATLWAGGIDNTWTNDTGYAILIETRIEGNEVMMRFWGTGRYDVETSTGPRRNTVPPQEIRDDSPACMPQQPVEGFDVTVTRVLLQEGQRVDTQRISTHYEPSDAVTCTHPDAG